MAGSSTVALTVRLAWAQLWGGGNPAVQTFFNAEVAYTEVVVAEILNLSLGTVTAAYHEPFTPPLIGTNLGLMLPSQNSIAISFTAGLRPNGTPLKGRSYMPPPSVQQLGPGGLLLSATRDRLAEAWDTFLTDLKTQSHLPSVWSRSIPTTQTIDSVRVGNKVDTIRTRRNKLPEAYMVQAI